MGREPFKFLSPFARFGEPRPVSDEPADTPYRVFTRDFDQIVAARDAPALIAAADRGLPPARPLGLPTWPARLKAVEQLSISAAPAFAKAEMIVAPVLARSCGDLAVMLLIDQSGSMHNNVLSVAVCVRWLSGIFDAHDVPISVTGFTTVGWRGGAARRQWQAAGKPKRPGRLCALLYPRYRDFAGPLDDEDFRAMVHPGVLRENVDGEAIEWAVDQLKNRSESKKVLVVLSDGAPVDDSTLMENGEAFLERHIRRVIADTEADYVVRLGAVGIEYRVDGYYSSSTDATDLTMLPIALASQIAVLAEHANGKEADPA